MFDLDSRRDLVAYGRTLGLAPRDAKRLNPHFGSFWLATSTISMVKTPGLLATSPSASPNSSPTF